jgi:hypothetical protein
MGEGAEEKAAALLNAVMVMLLACALAALAAWVIFDFLRSVTSANPDVSWERDGVVGFLIPLGLLPTAVSMFRWGLRIWKSG